MTLVDRRPRAQGALALTLTLAAVLAGAARPARAQSTVEAEVLFQEGKRLLKAGKIAEACDRFEASDRLETSVGTLLNAADCREKNNQIATAWGLFLKAAAAAQRGNNDGAREREARRRATALAARLSFLTISVPDSSKIEGLTIARRGQPVDPALWNQGVPVDVGEYEISASAPGHEPWTTKVVVAAEGQRAVIEVPRFKRLEDLAGAARPPQAPVAAAAGAPGLREVGDDADGEAEAAPGRRAGTFTTRRLIGLGVGVVGLAALGTGAVFALEADDLRGQADALCPGATCSDPRGVALNDDAKSAALRANVLFVAGGAAVAGGVALWILGKPAPVADGGDVAVRPIVTRGSLGFSVSGRF